MTSSNLKAIEGDEGFRGRLLLSKKLTWEKFAKSATSWPARSDIRMVQTTVNNRLSSVIFLS
jgi:hypothetical protein